MPYTPENGSFRYHYNFKNVGAASYTALSTIQNNAMPHVAGERLVIVNSATNWKLTLQLFSPTYASGLSEFNIRCTNGAHSTLPALNTTGETRNFQTAPTMGTLFCTFRFQQAGSGSGKDILVINSTGTFNSASIASQTFPITVEITMQSGTLTFKVGAAQAQLTSQSGYTGGDLIIDSDTGGITIDTIELTDL